MKRKTINKVIREKLEDWKNSITDESIKKDLFKNVMVSGGCIASMLMKQDVNDFDIYVKDINFLMKLARYYADKKSVGVFDGRNREKYMAEFREAQGFTGNHDVFESYDAAEYVRLRTLSPEQVKLDVPSEGIRYEPVEGKTYQVAFFSQNAISLTDKLQIVLRFTGSIEEIHKNYDFIHATNYYTPETGLVTNIQALESLISKDLKYQGSLYPLTSIIRMKKFILRGWTINAGEILKIMFQLSELNLKDVDVLEQQLIGVDIAYFSTLISVLRGVKKETITSQYLNTLIEKIFNETTDSEN